MKSEKPVAETTGRIDYLNHKPTMNKDTSKQSEFQFNSAKPSKVFQTIHCHNCHNERELDGFVFKLVEVCAACRTASELKNLANQIERRVKK